MARCKVYLFTYNRNELLKRAIESLINQTFKDWTCELHNDNPNDLFPIEYIEKIGDHRIEVVNHATNLGAVESFNLMFNPCKEEYIAMLEDDNWFEPTFIEEMVKSMETFEHIQVAFSNHFLWTEKNNNQWIKLPELKYSLANEYNLINYPQYRHVYHYHFSNCSAFFRNNDFISNYKIPKQTRGDFMEQVREKSFPHPILFVNKPLANFSFTLETYRKKSIKGFHEHNSLLVACFFKHNHTSDDWINELLKVVRTEFGLSINKFIYAALIESKCRKLIPKFKIYEWFNFLLYNIKHPFIFFSVLNSKKKYPELWSYLNVKSQDLVSKFK